MKRFRALNVTAVCLIALAIGSVMPPNGVSRERLLSDARQSYRQASIVALGECVDRHTGVSGSQISRVRITGVVAGKCRTGDLLSVEGSLAAGEGYLLYLAEGEDVAYAEDEISYVPTSSQPFMIKDGQVEYGGSRIPLSLVTRDMERLKGTITMPAAVYRYDTLDSLLEASENVFIGRVTGISPLKYTSFRCQSGGNTVEKKALCSRLAVTAYGSVKGAVGYGESVEVIYLPGDCGAMISAATLEPCPCGSDDIIKPMAGGTYLFFLGERRDPKQDAYCPVNPLQGWIGVEGDALVKPDANSAVAGYSYLGELVSDMRGVLK